MRVRLLLAGELGGREMHAYDRCRLSYYCSPLNGAAPNDSNTVIVTATEYVAEIDDLSISLSLQSIDFFFCLVLNCRQTHWQEQVRERACM